MARRVFAVPVLIAVAVIFVARLEAQSPLTIAGKWTRDFAGRPATLTFTADGKFAVEFFGDDQLEVWGRYEISGTQLTVTDEGGPRACTDNPGVYEVTIGAQSRTLKEVSDLCQGRLDGLQGEWTRVTRVIVSATTTTARELSLSLRSLARDATPFCAATRDDMPSVPTRVSASYHTRLL